MRKILLKITTTGILIIIGMFSVNTDFVLADVTRGQAKQKIDNIMQPPTTLRERNIRELR